MSNTSVSENPKPDRGESFAELWDTTLHRHRRVERWRAIRFRSGLVAAGTALGLAAYVALNAGGSPDTTVLAHSLDRVLSANADLRSPPAAIADIGPAPGTGPSADSLRGSAVQERAPTVPVIFDTDMGNSIDDSLALAMLHGYQSRGLVELLAITINYDNDQVAPYVDAINTYYGAGDTTIAAVKTGGVTSGHDAFHRQVAENRDRYPHDLISNDQLDSAVSQLRRRLASQPDHSVVVVATGFSTNLAQLLDSPPDEVADLDGRALVEAKVRLLAITAGDFLRAKPEHNTAKDPTSARQVFEQWPTPIVASEWQVGANLPFPGQSLVETEGGQPNPLLEAMVLNGQNALIVNFPYDPPSFDLTTVLYAVEPDAGYFTVGQLGRITLDDQLIARFEPDQAGWHRLLQRPIDPTTRRQITERFVELVSG